MLEQPKNIKLSQTTGQSTKEAMSQKAVTDEFNGIAQDISNLNDDVEDIDNEVAAQAIAANEKFVLQDGGTIWHKVTPWFTPTPGSTASSNGTTVTLTGSTQITSAMVGAKIQIGTEKRIITGFVSSNQFNVDRAFSANLVNVSVWYVWSVIFVNQPGNRLISFYTYNGINCGGFNHFTGNADFKAISTERVAIRFAANVVSFDNYLNNTGFEINSGTVGTYRDLILRNLTHTGTITNASDDRLKKDIRPVSDALAKVLKLAECVKHYEFINQNSYASGQRTGFIAQLLQAQGFEGHVSEREPRNEEEGLLFGWEYSDFTYEDQKPDEDGYITEQSEWVEHKVRLIDKRGSMILQVENNFDVYIYPAIAEMNERLKRIEEHLNIL